MNYICLLYTSQAILIDQSGKITVSSDSHKIENINVFDDTILKEFKTQILEDKKSFQMNWYPQSEANQCIISCYVAVSYTHLDVYKRQVWDL